jgi:putative addiction module component (TIGR02574 family)
MNTITELKSLSISERLLLVEDLWDSIALDQEALPDHPEVVEEIRRRRARFNANTESGMAWDQMKRRIRAAHA